MKKVLILTASYGYGHMASAKAIKEGIEQKYHHQIKVEIIDLPDEIRRNLNQFIGTSYQRTTKYAPPAYKFLFEATDSRRVVEAFGKFLFLGNSKRMAKFLTAKKPDLIMTNYPSFQEMVALAVKEYLPDVPLITFITDSISIHNSWASRFIDYYIVANRDSAKVLHQLGPKMSQIKVIGYPVSMDFAKPFNKKAFLAKQKLDPNRPTILFLPITDKVLRTRQIIRSLLEMGEINLVLVTGRNQDLYTRLNNFRKKHHFKLISWTNEMPSLIMASDLVITKAGGSTVMECIAAKTPLIIHHIIPGQEEGNAEYVQRYKLGQVRLEADQIAPAASEILAHQDFYKYNLAKHSKPKAAVKIADFIADIL